MNNSSFLKKSFTFPTWKKSENRRGWTFGSIILVVFAVILISLSIDRFYASKKFETNAKPAVATLVSCYTAPLREFYEKVSDQETIRDWRRRIDRARCVTFVSENGDQRYADFLFHNIFPRASNSYSFKGPVNIHYNDNYPIEVQLDSWFARWSAVLGFFVFGCLAFVGAVKNSKRPPPFAPDRWLPKRMNIRG